MVMRGKARHRSAKICVAKQRHSKDPLGVTRHSKGIAWQGDGQQRKGIDKLSMARARHSRAKASQGIAWQYSARAEDREAMLRKGRGYIQRSRREGGAMRKEEICNMDCLHCVHPDCINERPMTRQARYYWRHRERVLEKKKEDYQKRKAEKDGGL